MPNDYPAIAGHQLQHIVTPRWGDLVRVGDTKRAFKKLDQAKAYAREHALTYGSLVSEYQAFNLKNGLRLGSADEHLFDDTLSDQQRLWLIEFCRRWESIAEFERDFMEIREGDNGS